MEPSPNEYPDFYLSMIREFRARGFVNVVILMLVSTRGQLLRVCSLWFALLFKFFVCYLQILEWLLAYRAEVSGIKGSRV